MDLQLAGKRAIVTGSTSGIGAGTAKILAAEGVAVAIHGRDEGRAAAVAEEIRRGGGTAIVACGDLTNDDGAASVCEIVDRELGGVDILFNNAGGAVRDPALGGNPGFFDLAPSDWLGSFDNNVLSAVRMVKHLAPGMTERGYGRIVQNASAVASMPRETMNDYSGAKAAVVNLTVGLAKALAGTGVTANTVSPGLILTPQQLAGYSWLHAFANSQGWDDTLPLAELDRMWAAARNVPSGRAGRVENIGAVVALLASPLGAFINGANIRVDGGQNQSVN